MVSQYHFQTIFQEFQNACAKLEEVINMEKTLVVRDAAIQRFEFTLDLSRKVLKAWLAEDKGLICRLPKDCFRQAFQQGLIDYDDFWITMVDYRNQASHTYHKTPAEEIYEQLPKALGYFLSLKSNLGRTVQ